MLSVLVSLAVAHLCPAGSLEKALPALPGDIVGALVIGNLKEADASFRMFVEELGLMDQIPEEHRHPLDRLKEKLPGLTGFDEQGSLALVILKAASLPELMANVIVLLPASDTARMLDDLGGDPVSPGNDKVRSVLLFGQTMYATVFREHVAVARTAEVAGKLHAQKRTLQDRMPAHEVQSLAQTDAALWLDAAAILSIFKPQIDGMIGWGLMMQMGAGEVGEEEARASKNQIDNIVNGLSSLLAGMAVRKEGVSLRFVSSAKPDTELFRQTNHTIATSSLLRGLPRRNYLAVFGQELHPDAVHAALVSGLDPIFAGLRSEEGVGREKVAAIQEDLTRAIEMIRSLRGSIDHLHTERDGMLAVSLILETADSSAWLTLVERIAADVAALEPEWAPGEVEEDEEWTPDVTWVRDAEKIENLSVARLVVDILSDPELTDEDREDAKLLLGEEGVTFRVALADAKTVAVTFGGEQPQMARLLRAIRRNESPLEEDTGVALVNRNLPEKRSAMAIVAVDRIVNFADDISFALDPADPFPILLPRLDKPLGVAATGGPGWARYDLFVPLPLLQATITAAREMEEMESSLDEIESEQEQEHNEIYDGEPELEEPDEPRPSEPDEHD